MTDIYSGWTENRATWGKGSMGFMEQIKDVEGSLTFPLLGFDCDNSSELLNHHLLQYFTDHPNKVQFTRSRPYRKNDNTYVEQKNWTHVRHLFGYDRIDDKDLVRPMNRLYANEWSLIQNFFTPSVNLIEKHRVNSKYKKTYQKPKTPYQRLIDSSFVSQDKKDELTKTFESLNPFALRRQIERKLRRIFKYVSVTPNVKQRI